MSSRQVVIPRFQIVRKGKILKVVPVNRKFLVVGSEEGAHLRLKHPKLSPRHLEIRVVEGRYLEAMNVAGEGKVLLNGEAMDRARLREGDELNLGPVVLQLTYKRTGMTVADQAVHESTLPREDTVDELGPQTSIGGRNDDEATVVGGSEQIDELRQRAAALEREDSQGYTEAPTAEVPAYIPPPPQNVAVIPSKPSSDPAPVEALPSSDLASSQPGVSPVPDIPSPSTPGSATFDDIQLDPVPVVLIEPPGGGAQRVSLRVGSFVFGSGRCAFRLSYPGIAPEHTELMVMPDGALYLKHLAGSKLLTLRNGAPIQFCRWNPGDSLQIGPVSMAIEYQQEDGAPVPAPTPADEAAPAQGSIDPKTATGGLEPERGLPASEGVAQTAPMPAAAAATPPASFGDASLSARSAPAQRDPSKGDAKKQGKKRKKKDGKSEGDPFASYRGDELDYQQPLWKRAMTPVVILGLLVGAGGMFWPQISEKLDLAQGTPSEAAEEQVVVKRATGASGINDARDGAQAVGTGPLSIGSAARPAGQGGNWGDPGIDWDNRERMKFGNGKPYQTDHSQPQNYGQSADTIEAKKQAPAQPAAATATMNSGITQVAATPTAPAPTGPADLSEVKNLIYGNQRMLRQCYTQLRVDNPSLAGTMWLEMSLGSDQRLRNVRVQARSTLKDEALRSCLERRLFSLTVPAPPGGPHTVIVPLEFAVSE